MNIYIIALIISVILGLLIFRNWYGIIFGVLTLGIFVLIWSIFRNFNISSKGSYFFLVILSIILSSFIAIVLINTIIEQPISYVYGIAGGSAIVFITFIVIVMSLL